jgi:hypothetical protein
MLDEHAPPFSWSATMDVASAPARVNLSQYAVGSVATRILSPVQGTSVDASMAGFDINNPGQSDIYVELVPALGVLAFGALDPTLLPPSDYPGVMTIAGLTDAVVLGNIAHTGTVTANLWARQPSKGSGSFEPMSFEDGWTLGSDAPLDGIYGVISSKPLRVLPRTPSVAVASPPVASLTFPVRTFNNQKSYTADPDTLASGADPVPVEDEPTPSPGKLVMTASGSGDLRVLRGVPPVVIAQGRI